MTKTSTRQVISNNRTNADDKRYRLSRQQLRLLEFIYTYRFVTTKQTQQFLGKKQIQQAQQRLNTLLTKRFIGRKYSSEDKLLGRYATYFLLPDGLKLLRYYGDRQTLKNMRKDATASERFAKHCVAIGNIADSLLRSHRDMDLARVFTKNELIRTESGDDDGSDDFEPTYASFPQPLPDILLELYDSEGNGQDYLLEVWHDTIPFWVYHNRIKYYIEYADEGIWKDEFGSALPPVLLVCDTPTLQRRVQRYLRRMYDEIDENELSFLTTNHQLLDEATASRTIWTRVGEEGNEVVPLFPAS